jgi:hypothetical protein
MTRRSRKIHMESLPVKDMDVAPLHAINVPQDVPTNAIMAAGVRMECGHPHVGLVMTVDDRFLAALGPAGSSVNDTELAIIVCAVALAALPRMIEATFGLQVASAAVDMVVNMDADQPVGELPDLPPELAEVLSRLDTIRRRMGDTN